MRPVIVWFRQDLRIEDQPALMAAIERRGAVIPVYIWAPDEEGEWSYGGASRWWLHYSLEKLQDKLEKLGAPLIIRRGASLQTLLDLVQATGADTIFWNRRYEPFSVQRDAFIKAELQKQGAKAQSFNGSLLYEPWTVFNKQNKPFQVFTPFWKHYLSLGEPPKPLSAPSKIKGYIGEIESDTLSSLSLLPKVHWDIGLEQAWRPGEEGARETLDHALKHVIADYQKTRDFPALNGVSHLSPYLHHGEISPRQIWQAIHQRFKADNEGATAFLRQLVWREFGYYLVYHFPYTPAEPLKKDFESFPWKTNYPDLRAWQNGKTGYPFVDAGMRQLWAIGWMHNRARLVAASFLVKDLLIRWQEGSKWFWDTLVDADLANNTLGWQWVAGCGADAAPYFRIFNPIQQGERYDPKGEYVRQWLPELRGLPDKWIHRPWEAPADVLKKAGVELGKTYPYPIVDHAEAREKALEAFAKL